jgi:serine/threonine protein kinase
VSIASDSSSSGLSELSENAIFEKAKAKQNGDRSKMKNSDDDGSQEEKAD